MRLSKLVSDSTFNDMYTDVLHLNYNSELPLDEVARKVVTEYMDKGKIYSKLTEEEATHLSYELQQAFGYGLNEYTNIKKSPGN